MKYLITIPNMKPFYTPWFDGENNFVDGMTVFNLEDESYTTNGIDWLEISKDHL